MPIKRLRFSFDVPMTQLLGLIVTGNADMRIDVLGDDKPVKKQLNGPHPGVKLLEGPKKPHGNIGNGGAKTRGKDASGKPLTAYNAILRALAKAPDHTLTLAALRPMVEELGLNASSANSQISLMRERGHAKRVGEGTYGATPRGLHEAVARGLVKGDKPKPKKKPKQEAQEIETPVTEETNG